MESLIANAKTDDLQTSRALTRIRAKINELVESANLPGGGSFIGLTDVPGSYSGAGGFLVKVNPGATGLEFQAGGGGVASFSDLDDVPAAYTGAGYKLVRVNTGETALEFATLQGTSNQVTVTPGAGVATLSLPQDINTAGGPTFGHLHISDLAAIYTAAESWVGPSAADGIYFKGGYVGIGTVSPADKLTVEGVIGAGSTATNGEIRSYQVYATPRYVSLKTSSDKAGIYRNNYDTFLFYLNLSTGNTVVSSVHSTKSILLAIADVEKIRIDPNGNFGIGQTTFGASAQRVLAIGTGVAPSDSPADAFQLYSTDFAAGNACPTFRTENGTVIQLNQSLLTTSSPAFAGATIGALGGILIGTAGVVSAITNSSANWNTAYGWGDHSAAGYALTTRKLDDFGAPDNNTDLDATTSAHGLLPKLGGGTTNFLRADGTYATPPGGGAAFPVGSVFIAVVATNPATLLGYGTWAAFGTGRVLVGIDSGDADFDTVEETGGAKTKAISAHAGTAVGNHAPTDTEAADAGVTAKGSTASTLTLKAHTHQTPLFTHSVTQPGAHTDISVVQPYIVVYMWKRTA